MRLRRNDIVSDSMKDNETWNSCHVCNNSWKSKKAIPGLLHRTVKCSKCISRIRRGVKVQ